MIQRQLKLKLTKAQEAKLNEWLWILTGVHNWAVRKIELDARDGRYHSKYDLSKLITGHCDRLGIPHQAIEATINTAADSWQRCFRKISGKPRLKGRRNKLNGIPFKAKFTAPQGNRIHVAVLGNVRFHKQELPVGKIKCGRIVKRASGWYLCLFIDAEPNAIPITSNGQIGIDPGFKHLLTLSTGEKIEHPRELEAGARRLAQAQRGRNKKLAARLQERMANQRKDRNHKLSRRLVSENALIVMSADGHKSIAKKFGKSVTSSSHYQLRQMLSYKCRTDGRKYVEVSPRYSTMTCSTCLSRTGPTGLRGLAVRRWTCSVCGTEHDRDINAAKNTLHAGAGCALESKSNFTSETNEN